LIHTSVDARLTGVIDGVAPARVWTRHPVWTVLVVALLLRLGVSTVLLASGHWPIAPDERQYVELAGVVADGHPASAWDPSWGNDLFAQTSTFLVPIVALFRVFGQHVFFGMLVAGIAGALAAALTARLAIAARLSPPWALFAGSVLALLPSQVLWSSLVLRESATWAALAGVALLLTIALRTTDVARLALLLLGVSASLFALFHLRPYVFVVACWAVFGAAVLGAPARRLATPFAALAVMLLLPLICGIGIGGLSLVSTNLPVLAKIQAHLADGADSAIVKPPPSPAPPPTSTAAPSARPIEDTGDGAANGLSGVVRGAIAVTLRPFPWERPTGAGALLAQVENLGWLVLYVLAAMGLWVRRRERHLLAFPVVFGAGFVVMSAMFEGNVGTAFRHRGQIAWALALLATCGLQAVLARRAERRSTR
jgi:hypothetical protein